MFKGIIFWPSKERGNLFVYLIDLLGDLHGEGRQPKQEDQGQLGQVEHDAPTC